MTISSFTDASPFSITIRKRLAETVSVLFIRLVIELDNQCNIPGKATVIQACGRSAIVLTGITAGVPPLKPVIPQCGDVSAPLKPGIPRGKHLSVAKHLLECRGANHQEATSALVTGAPAAPFC